jgi:glutamyl-tRNA(Gln) amidotransferase subunit D
MHNAGDKVKITTVEDTFEGILIPRPAVLDPNITVLKLDNGYNIGISNKKIKKTEVLEQYKKAVKKTPKLKNNSKLPTVAVISTGGTISSSVDYRTGGVYADFTAEDFVAMCPELSNIANLKAKKFMSIMSEDITPQDWVKIAKEVVKQLNDCDGVVVTMGTDTLATTAAALSFLIKDLNKPVIITGAQRSIDRGSTDAFMNLICSVTAAAKWNSSCIATCLHGTISDDFCLLIRGTKCRKMHTSRRDAFRPVNDLPLARVFTDGCIEPVQDVQPRSDSKPSIRKINENVALVQVYPGIDPKSVDAIAKSADGLIIAATALGHVPTDIDKSLLPILKKHAKRIPLIITSQTLYGRVNRYVYTPLRKLSIETGCIFAEDTLPEVALSKLMVALAEDPDHARELMQTNLSGEISSRELAGCFLR